MFVTFLEELMSSVFLNIFCGRNNDCFKLGTMIMILLWNKSKYQIEYQSSPSILQKNTIELMSIRMLTLKFVKLEKYHTQKGFRSCKQFC